MKKKIIFSLFLVSFYIAAVIIIPGLHIAGIICPHDHPCSDSISHCNCIEYRHNSFRAHQHVQALENNCRLSETCLNPQHENKAGHVLKSKHSCHTDECSICQFIASLAAVKNVEFKSLSQYSVPMESNIDFIALFLSKKISPSNPPTGPPLV